MKEKRYFIRTTLALTKASFRAVLRSPSFIIFSIAFPVVFILAFGFIGDGSTKIEVALTPQSDTTGVVFKHLKEHPVLHFEKLDANASKKALLEGQICALLTIEKAQSKEQSETLQVQYSDSSSNKLLLKQIIENLAYKMNSDTRDLIQKLSVEEKTVVGRKYKRIDFILPGQLGFSLMSAGVFGTAFAFVVAKKTMVIKKYFTTPVSKYSILFAEVISRIGFSLISAIIILLLGYFLFDFTLVNGWVSLFSMLVFSVFALFLFLGVGLFISSVVKDEKNVPPLANIFTLPQFLISGTFFPITVYPKWLQTIAYALPLTHFNEGMRKIAFEGYNLWDLKLEFLVLFIWIIFVFFITAKVFKWH